MYKSSSLAVSLVCITMHYIAIVESKGMLFPQESESREIKELNGIWDFRTDKHLEGFDGHWYAKPLKTTGDVINMPVPSSYNDVTQDKSIRDYIGWVWYQRDFYVSADWRKKRVVLRFDSAHYATHVWVNGEYVMNHIGGHLPFEAKVNKRLKFGGLNTVTVALNNVLTPTTLPPGILYKYNSSQYPPGFQRQWYQFDFFNYAGLHRSVKLYTTPKVWIDDVTLVTKITNTKGVLSYNIVASANVENAAVTIRDINGTKIATASNLKGNIVVESVKPWWPYTMNRESPAYLYTLEIAIQVGETLTDIYRLKFGFRTVRVTENKLLINDKEFYCRGVGMHEDTNMRGKGLDFVSIVKDFNLLKWLGVNCFRTSHYPYAEEIMNEADKQGIVVIDESPGVGIVKKKFYGRKSLNHHKEVMTELIRRDKNHPSVIIWSIANEPTANRPYAVPYFTALINHTRSLDPTRLVTVVLGGRATWIDDKVPDLCDILCYNSYISWYGEFGGHTELIKPQFSTKLDDWFKRYSKPIIITEYGAGTINGMHASPSAMFTEEYQCDFLKAYQEVFDVYRKRFLVGEMVWNFADFMTAQVSNRVNGNRKGLFTRDRQPKMAAHLVRARYNNHDSLFYRERSDVESNTTLKVI